MKIESYRAPETRLPVVLYKDKVGKNTVHMFFVNYRHDGQPYYHRDWQVILAITHKRIVYEDITRINNDKLYNMQTGTGDIQCLLLAKMMLQDFIETQLKQDWYADENHTIHIYGSNKRRFTIYERYLNDLGFKKSQYDDELFLNIS